nr:stathmin-1-A [Ciona intestinalis]|eukprot:XP_002130876.1 stathmin-1-A [Ciona intestinalis]
MAAQREDIKVKEICKGNSGEAFEVILKLPGQNGDGVASPLKSLTPKKEVSMDEIKMKLQAAEERRKAVQEAKVTQQKAEEEKILKAKQKKAEVNDSFSQWAEQHLKKQMCQYQENHIAQLEAKIKKFKALNMKPEEMKEKVQREVDEMCAQREAGIQQKLIKSEELRQKQLQKVRERQQEKENHAQEVRHKKVVGGQTTGVCE